MITFDFHSHTTYADGADSASTMVEAAIAKGLRTYGISEHHPRHPDFRYRDDPPGEVRGLAQWSEYLAEMDALKKQHASKIELLKGSEFDWLGVDYLPEWQKWRAESDYDYIIGSVHYIGHWGFDYLEDWEQRYDFPELKEREGILNYDSIEQIYTAYYKHVVEMVEHGAEHFDIVGHLDLIKKFVKETPSNALEEATKALDAIAQTDLVLELSSAGLTKPCKDWYPNVELLKAARERDIPLTLNSDAHQTSRIAEGFTEAVALAKSVGYESVVCLHAGGERENIKL